MRIEILKAFNPSQRRDSHGRWVSTGVGSGGQKTGEQHYRFGRTATLESMHYKQFSEMATKTPLKLTNAVARAIKSPGGNTLNGIYAHIGQAFGIAPGPGLAKHVDNVLKDMYKKGDITVKKEIMAERHGKDVAGLTSGGNLKAGSVKWGWNAAEGRYERLEREQFSIELTNKNPRYKTIPKLPTPTHTLGTTKPDRFDPAAGSLAEKALAYRRKTYGDTKVSPMGRYFSSMKEAPEMQLGEDKQAKGKHNRNEYFAKKDKYFFDATSSVTAHIGVMTNDTNSLVMSKLMPQTSKPPQHELMMQLGIKEKNTGKPYFSSFAGAYKITKSDFGDLPVNEQNIKEIAKSIWTPGSYGSPVGAMHQRLEGKLKAMGMTDPAARKNLRDKLIGNFQGTAMYKFTPAFKRIVAEAPDNFVYENPMSGFRMSFNEFSTQRHRLTLGENRLSVEVPTVIARDRNGNRKAGAAAPLFIQNWDAALIGHLMHKMDSPHTAHDAIGVSKKDQSKLNSAVVEGMNQIKHHDPLKNLARQIVRTHLHNGMAPPMARKLKLKLYALVNAMKSQHHLEDLKVNPDVGNNHFQPEF